MAIYRLTESRLRNIIRESIKSILNEDNGEDNGVWATKIKAFINGLKTGNVECIDDKIIGVPIGTYGDNTNHTEMVTYCIDKPVLYDEYTSPTSYNLDDKTFKYINDLSNTYYHVLTSNFKNILSDYEMRKRDRYPGAKRISDIAGRRLQNNY